jgi:hypothetical protein
MKRIRVLVLAAALGGCATTGSTYGSGVGDAFLEHAPFYAGAGVRAVAQGSLGFFPVAYQRGASQPELFDPEQTQELTSLLQEMSGYLVDVGAGTLLATEAHATRPQGLRPPDVRLGCVTESGMADDDCAERTDGALGRGRQPMHLAVGRPSPAWVGWAAAAMTDAGVEHALVLRSSWAPATSFASRG